MTRQHTPGPWVAVRDIKSKETRVDAPIPGVDDFMQAICRVYEKGDTAYDKNGDTVGFTAPEERDANANLIAAAPDLMQACKSSLNQFKQLRSMASKEECDTIFGDVEEMLRLAIAKGEKG